MNILSVVLFVVFVSSVLGLSFYFAGRAKSASGYYAAGGRIHWASTVSPSPATTFRQLPSWASAA